MKNEITNVVYTKSGVKLMSISLFIILIALVFFVWGLIRFILINPVKYAANTKNRRQDRRVRKLQRLETKRQLRAFKENK